MFVVFEGIDGSGKTTLSNMVFERLCARGLKAKHLRAGGQFVSTVSEAIRSLGRDARNLDMVPATEFMLYVARDVQLIEEALKPALKNHDVVFADRFLYTAEVIATSGRRLLAAFTAPVLKVAASGITPDLVVLMDVDPTLARARRKAHKRAVGDVRPPSRRGLGGVGLQHRLRQGYLALANSRPETWVVVENDQKLDEAAARVSDLIEHSLMHGVEPAVRRYRQQAASHTASDSPALANTRQALERFMRWVELRAETEPRVAAYMLAGLWGEGVDTLRRALMEHVPEAVIASLHGLRDAVSCECRDRAKTAFAAPVARSLAGCPNTDERARGLRLELAPVAPREVLVTLAGLDDETAWELRAQLGGREPNALMQSLAQLSSARAWTLRQRWLDACTELMGTHYDLASVASRSVHGLGDERAFEVRETAKRAAPVAALNSLAGVGCEQSFRWRERYITRAPKPVMMTLRGSADPRAFALRARVAADCKEAIDSIGGLDAEQAWSLRETYVDVWPSTVLKSLGPLADTVRGQCLVERLLDAHAQNISLLKHASALALGLHHAPYADD